jgi:superfamily II DNA or RNA helicase
VYAAIMNSLLAPVRIGLTATFPKDPEAALAVEGCFGPIIGEVTIQEGVEAGFLARPVIKLIPVPFNVDIRDLKRWAQIYDKGVVNHVARNRIIARLTRDLVAREETVLIIVNIIEHGDNIQKVLRQLGVSSEYIQGSSDAYVREHVRKSLNERKILCVIATAVFKEGVNIPGLNNVINAAGGKSEIATLQAIGRGLRVTDDKKFVTIYDFLDSGRYIAEHAVERMKIYVDSGWL